MLDLRVVRRAPTAESSRSTRILLARIKLISVDENASERGAWKIDFYLPRLLAKESKEQIIRRDPPVQRNYNQYESGTKHLRVEQQREK